MRMTGTDSVIWCDLMDVSFDSLAVRAYPGAPGGFIPPPQALTGTSEAHSSPMLRCSLRHSGKHITTSESNNEKDIMKQRERTKEQQELQDALLPLGSRVYFHEEKGYTPSCTKGPFQASLSPRNRSLWGTRRYERWLRLRKTTSRVMSSCD